MKINLVTYPILAMALTVAASEVAAPAISGPQSSASVEDHAKSAKELRDYADRKDKEAADASREAKELGDRVSGEKAREAIDKLDKVAAENVRDAVKGAGDYFSGKKEKAAEKAGKMAGKLFDAKDKAEGAVTDIGSPELASKRDKASEKAEAAKKEANLARELAERQEKAAKDAADKAAKEKAAKEAANRAAQEKAKPSPPSRPVRDREIRDHSPREYHGNDRAAEKAGRTA